MLKRKDRQAVIKENQMGNPSFLLTILSVAILATACATPNPAYSEAGLKPEPEPASFHELAGCVSKPHV